jgi:hypothetical protein
VMLVLIMVAFIGYERRVHRVHVHPPTPPQIKTSPNPAQTEHEQ